MLLRPILFLMVVVLLALSHAAGQQPLQELDKLIPQAMHDLEIPGLSIAVVKDDAVVLTKGYGVRKLGEPARVDEHTLFMIASTTKAFTAASLAMFVDEGKLKWDDPVLKYLPTFQLYDPYVTRELTVRDLLTHRTGLDDVDALVIGSAYSREEVLRRIRFLKPGSSFRSRFEYNNTMYVVAGEIIPAISGKSWDDFVREGIFEPLGMTESSTSVSALQNFSNVATPHRLIDSKVVPLPLLNVDNAAPAAGINSNAVDMAQWIRLQLGEGVYQGKRVLSAQRVREMQTPNIVLDIPKGGLDKFHVPADHFLTCGLGWFVMDYRGRKIVLHPGAIQGFKSEVLLVPEEKLGIAILSNLYDRPLPWVLGYRVIDAYLNVPPRDWAGEYLKALKGFEEDERAKDAKAEAERNRETKPSLPIERYAGTYKNEMFGDAIVSVDDGHLILHFVGLNWGGILAHWQFDTFQDVWENPYYVHPKSFVTFALNPKGNVDSMRVELGVVADFHRASEPGKK